MTIAVHAIEMQAHADDNVVAFRLSGKLTRDDYEMFVPVLEEQIREHGKIRLLVELDDFHGWSAGAIWEDLKFDFRHFRDIERIAIIGESDWEKGMSIFCKPFTAASVKYFNIANREEARNWIEAQN